MDRSIRITLTLVLALAAAGAPAVRAEAPAQELGVVNESWGTPLVISAADFRNNGNGMEDFFFSPNGYITGDGSPVVMVAPVYLPTGAMVHEVAAVVYDNSTSCATADILVWLNRVGAGYGTGSETMASMSTSGAVAFMQTISTTGISNAFVNNIGYCYNLTVMMCSSAHELHSVVISYTE